MTVYIFHFLRFIHERLWINKNQEWLGKTKIFDILDEVNGDQTFKTLLHSDPGNAFSYIQGKLLKEYVY